MARKQASGLSKLFGGKSKVIQGTHSYMSPEQIRGQALDFRADVYSFGCMVHEFFSGKPPFTANTPTELLQAHLSRKPQPITVFNKNVTPEFATYVQQHAGQGPQGSASHDERCDDGPQDSKNVLQPTAAPKPSRRSKSSSRKSKRYEARRIELRKSNELKMLFLLLHSRSVSRNPVNPPSMASTYQLPFEQPIYKLEEQIKQLESAEPKTVELRDQIRVLKRELTDTTRSIYSKLDPWDTVQVARHPDRPMLTDYLNLVFDEFVELHGDKFFGDDRALRTGFAKLDRYKVLVVGHQKGKTLKERNECFFGCAHPEGYRKAMSKMKLAAKYKLPIICLIDTPGAYPGIGAEERGQAQVIAESMLEMSRLPTPIICVVIGEGGSGGALGIGVGDRVAMLAVRLLLGHQPRRLRRHSLEEPRLRLERRPGAENSRRRISMSLAASMM